MRKSGFFRCPCRKIHSVRGVDSNSLCDKCNRKLQPQMNGILVEPELLPNGTVVLALWNYNNWMPMNAPLFANSCQEWTVVGYSHITNYYYLQRYPGAPIFGMPAYSIGIRFRPLRWP